MTKIATVLLSLLFAATSAFASLSNCDGSGNCYVNPSVSGGTSDGSSWTNACPALTTTACAIASGTRPATAMTVWVAAGAYGSRTFGLTANGTNVVTVEAPTVANHGTATGWSNSYAGQATFVGQSAVTTNYWTFNGQAWPSGCSGQIACAVTGYNLYFHNATASGIGITIAGASDLTFEYVEAQGSTGSYSSGGTSGADDLISTGGSTSGQCSGNDDFAYDYLHDPGTDILSFNDGSCSAYGNVTVEHSALKDNCTAGAQRSGGTTYNHCQGIIMLNGGQFIARYNQFIDIGSSGVITTADAAAVPVSNWYIYGNQVWWDNAFIAGGGNGVTQAIGFADGFVALFGEDFTGVLQIYNNSWANMNYSGGCAIGSCTWLFVLGTSGGSSGNVTATIYNNLWWQAGTYQDYVLDSSSDWTPTADYNVGYCPSGGCTNPGYATSGSHDQLKNTGNPFTNFDGSSNFTMSLAADTTAGLSISDWSTMPSGCSGNCENIDGLTVTRGANGTIDRGALQIGNAVPAPTAAMFVDNDSIGR